MSGRDSRRLLMETTPDDLSYMSVVEEASRVAGQNASQLVILTAELRREVHGLLTQEQRIKAGEMRSNMRERFRERKQRRRARQESAGEG